MTETVQGIAELMGVPDADRVRHSPLALVGDTDSCREEILRRQHELDVSYFVCRFKDVDMMRRFGEQVIGRL